FHRVPDKPEALANPVTIYVTRDVPAIQRLAGRLGSGVAGFYKAESGRAVAFTPARAGTGSKRDLNPQLILFHEYAHHFLLQNSGVAYPYWFSEGYAEFASTARFDEKYATVGSYALHRVDELFGGYEPTIRQLFATPPERGIFIYGRGWLLTHYLMFNPDRKKQFTKYLDLFNTGKSGVAAAEEAFGDLDSLNTQLNSYRAKRAIPGLSILLSALPQPTVSIRALGPGAAALMEMRMASTVGVSDKTAAPLYARAAPIAAKYPDDAEAQGWFAEMAYDAGQNEVADTAADHALSRDPKSSQALLYKARIAMRRAGSDPKAWTAARAYILKANALANDNAAALLLFYESFASQGIRPTKGAVSALYRAALLTPQDETLRYMAARQLLTDGDLPAARRVIRPAAYDPHGGVDTPAARMLTIVEGNSSAPAALVALQKSEAEATAKAQAVAKKGS
ncbi:MAG TPA: hypothetical protein VF637_12220, partial [Sphingomicrobium sp.]